ncbi:MAG: YlxR family protein [Synechococcus sp.]
MSKMPLLRRCAACRRLAHRDRFLRLVRQHDTGQVQIGQGMGRSAYLCPTKQCVERIRKKNRLRHALKANVSDELFDSLLAALKTREERSRNIGGLVIDE